MSYGLEQKKIGHGKYIRLCQLGILNSTVSSFCQFLKQLKKIGYKEMKIIFAKK